MKIKQIFIRQFFRLFNCVSLWATDISHRKVFRERILKGYSFMVLKTPEEIKLNMQKIMRNRLDKYRFVLEERIENGTYWCYAFIHKKTCIFACTRWTCLKKFYYQPMKKTINLDKHEIFTLDSFTHPDHRRKGLHKEMNKRMLNYLMKNTSYEKVYMAINCFLGHLIKVVKPLGYKRIKTKLSFNKESIQYFLKKLIRIKGH
jgi:GNAT superfamily N-acetyltransferase